MGEAGCLKDGVFKNLQVNGNIDLENAISKSMPLRKTVVYDYNGFEAGKTLAEAGTHATTLTYAQTVSLPSNALVYKAYVFVRQNNEFTGSGINPGAGAVSIGGTGGSISVKSSLVFTANEVVELNLAGQVGISGTITITATTPTAPGTAGAAEPGDIWAKVGQLVIFLDYFIL